MPSPAISRRRHIELGLIVRVVIVRLSVYESVREFVFTALHGLLTRSSDENSICPSVCLSTRALWQNGFSSVQIFIPYERSFSLVFWEEEWLVKAIPSTWNFGSTGFRWNEIAGFEPIFARSVSAVTPSEKKVQLTVIGSQLRAF